MIFVLITFLSILCMFFAYSNYYRQKHYLVWLIISILFLIIPATIRDISVGTDVMVYQYPILNRALTLDNFIAFYNRAKWIASDKIYLVLVYLCAKIFKSIHALFFFEEVLVLTPIYYVIWHCKDKINPVYSLMAYEGLFYIETYNVIRQHMAISFFVLGLYFYANQKNMFKYFLFSIIAVGIHQSAFIFPLFPLSMRVVEIKNKRNRRLLIVAIICLILLLSFYYEPIIRFLLARLKFLPPRYQGKRYLSIENPNFPDMDIAIVVLGIVFLFYSRKRLKDDSMINWLLLMNYIVLATSYFAMMVEFGSRILWYFKIFNIFSLGYGVNIAGKGVIGRILFFFFMFAVLSFYWIYIYYISGSAGVFPYEIAESFKL